jgi:hypothetical protein
MNEFSWVTVGQPLFVARTGMVRGLLGQGRGKTRSGWEETLDAATAALEDFCRPERVYALGVNDETASRARPAYLVAHTVYYDNGWAGESEVYFTADTAEGARDAAQAWVSGWIARAQPHVPDDD